MNASEKVKRMNKEIVEKFSCGTLFGGALIFGLMGRPAEMAGAIAAGALGLFFCNLDKFESFSAGGVAARLRDQIADVTHRVETMAGKETEPPDSSEEPSGFMRVEAYSFDDYTRNVIKALAYSDYVWRYPSGVAGDAGLTRPDALRLLQWLVNNGLANEASGKNGTVFGLSEKGWSIVRSNPDLRA